MAEPVRPARIYNSPAARQAARQVAYKVARSCGLEPAVARRLVGKVWRELQAQPLPNGYISVGALKANVRQQAVDMPDELLEELSRQAQEEQG